MTDLSLLQQRAFERLLQWKAQSRGSTAILIDGPRGVGKTTLAHRFAQSQYASHLLIDYALADAEVLDIFGVASSLDHFFQKLQIRFGVTLLHRRSLVIFDAVQHFPRARQLVKYLVADGRYDYLETGSLVGLHRNVRDILIPSEEEKLALRPLDFDAFLRALGEADLADFLLQSFQDRTPLGDTPLRKGMDLFRRYLITGGLPSVVAAFAPNRDLAAAEAEKRRVLLLWRSDLTDRAVGREKRALTIFEALPRVLQAQDKTLRPAAFGENLRYRSLVPALNRLSAAHVVTPALIARDPDDFLGVDPERNAVRLFCADTGLLLTTGLASGAFPATIVNELLTAPLAARHGAFAVNAAARQLAREDRPLLFYARPADRANHQAAINIDFLLRRQGAVCPVTVETTVRLRHASSAAFEKRFGAVLGTRYLLWSRDLEVAGPVMRLPHCMAHCLAPAFGAPPATNR